jgi:hypothetical protein
MSDLGIGKLITGAAQRDAIHIAVAPVVAGHRITPGQHVGLDAEGVAVNSDSPVGIADPYLKTPARKGDTFWLFMYPNTITSLRHDWTHPAFGQEAPIPPPSPDVKYAMSAIELIARGLDVEAQDLIEATTTFLETGEYWYGGWREDGDGSNFSGGEDLPDEYWDHYEVVVGKAVPGRKREHFFSCSC